MQNQAFSDIEPAEWLYFYLDSFCDSSNGEELSISIELDRRHNARVVEEVCSVVERGESAESGVLGDAIDTRAELVQVKVGQTVAQLLALHFRICACHHI